MRKELNKIITDKSWALVKQIRVDDQFPNKETILSITDALITLLDKKLEGMKKTMSMGYLTKDKQFVEFYNSVIDDIRKELK